MTRAALVLALALVLPPAAAQERGDQAERDALAGEVERLEAFSAVFRRVAALARPSVVSVQLTLAGEVFSHATGVIVDGGSVLTSHHAVLQDPRVGLRVVLHDGRTLGASIAGGDPLTDLALLRFEDPPADLVPALLGDSDGVRVGDWVLAVGSPFGLEQTVTAGIVSATERAVGFEDFLQTDAALNPGNSGGPLLNLRGEVIGINAAIASGSGVSSGVGFATPSAVVRHVAAELAQRGRVVRGWLGVVVRELTPPERDALRAPAGLLVTGLAPDGPAGRGGLRPGDVLVSLGGAPVPDARALRRRVASAVGETLPVVVWRAGDLVALDVGVTELRAPALPSATSARRTAQGERSLGLHAGVSQHGDVVVTNVDPGSLAERVGLRAGWIVRELGGRPLRSAADLDAALAALDLARGVRLVVESPGGDRRVVVVRSLG